MGFREMARLGLGALGVALAATVCLPAQQPAVFQIDFTHAEQFPAHWRLKVNADGSGQFDSDGGTIPAAQAAQIVAGELHRPVQLSPQFAGQIFTTARQRKFFRMGCESHLKVAFQGTKRFSYTGPEGSGACEFNYSKDKEIQALSDSLIAVETTLLYGVRLDKMLLHDRLGLDREMDGLVAAVQDGNAIELGTIRDTLTRIADDDQVLDRDRRKARKLLAQTAPEVAGSLRPAGSR
jgi:hypothetical protein